MWKILQTVRNQKTIKNSPIFMKFGIVESESHIELNKPTNCHNFLSQFAGINR